MGRPFEVLKGGKPTLDNPGFICPWCGAAFKRRYIADDGPPTAATVQVTSLEDHWRSDPRCRKNALVNNPMQTKYHEPEVRKGPEAVED